MGKSRRQAVTLLAMLLALCGCAFALDPSLNISQYAHTSWKTRDGFAKGGMESIAQTPDGYLWLGTEFGLFRFDGVRAVPWQPPGPQHLAAGTILSLLVSQKGTLWIGTDTGLASWEHDQLSRYPELEGEGIYALLEDHEGTIWVAAGGKPLSGKLCAIRSGRTDCFGGNGQLGWGVVSLHEDKDGNLWAGVLGGVWKWKPGPPKFYSLPGELDGIQAFAEDNKGTLLVGWKRGIYRFKDGKAEPYPVPSVSGEFHARRILRDRDGSLWIANLHHGLMHIHQGRADRFENLDGLSGNEVLNFFQDREGNVWAATLEGLDRFRDLPVATLKAKEGLSNALVGSVLADSHGSVWLSTYGGLNIWNRGQISLPTAGLDRDGGPNESSAHGSLFEDQQGRVWLSSFNQTGYFEKHTFTRVENIPAGPVLCVTQDTLGNVWILKESVGLIRISPQHEVRQISWAELGHKDNATVFAADRKRGGLWVGFFLGGIAYFSDGQIRASYSTADGLGGGRISDFQFEQDGALWISTEAGISRLKNNHLTTLTIKNGLPCDKVHWSIQADDQSFWLYTACGLLRISHSEIEDWASAVDKGFTQTRPVHVTALDESDGVRALFSPSHYHPQVAKTPDGKIWFLPWDGVSVIDPHHLPFNKLPPPVHIQKITADDKSVDISNGMQLPTGVRHLDIDYTALSLVVPEKVRFRVKLEGEDTDWRELVNVRHVEYTNLPPKHYKFRVLACNNSGVWNEEGAALDFVIPPAWYQTNWFRGACIAAFLMTIWGIHELRVRQLAAQFNMRLEERVAERTRIARDLHDTLLQSFQGLLLQFKAVSYQLQPGKSKTALDAAIGDASQAITEGRDTVQGLRASIREKNDLAEAIRAFGEDLASSASSQSPVAFEVVVEGRRRRKPAFLRDEIYRIATEALRNAFRHAQADRIEVDLQYGDKAFKLRVRDNGRGIDRDVLSADGRKGHFGLHGMRERATVAGGELAIWSEVHSGTEIELTIPASRAYTTSARRFW